MRQWYITNGAQHRQRMSDRKAGLRRWMKEFKRTLRCAHCGEDHPATLDFHHANGGKDISVALMANSGFSQESILAEAAKCVVLCANCHRKEHFGALFI